jgi:rare lipoprotein A (peptidoglycan hydrolase)
MPFFELLGFSAMQLGYPFLTTSNQGAIATPPPMPQARLAPAWIDTPQENFCQVDPPLVNYSWTLQNNPAALGQSWLRLSSAGMSNTSLPQKVMQILFGWQAVAITQTRQPDRQVQVTKSDARGRYQVWLQQTLIVELSAAKDADNLAQNLRSLIAIPNLDAQQLQPAMINQVPAVRLGDRWALVVDETLHRNIATNGELIAIKLANNLRLALGAPALSLAAAQATMHNLTPTNQSFSGLASWYGPYFHGRITANGETYDQYALTVAHPSLPFDTYLKVTNQKNGRSVILRVNDRGPYIPPRVLDVSKMAARCLDAEETGVFMTEVVFMQSQNALATTNP